MKIQENNLLCSLIVFLYSNKLNCGLILHTPQSFLTSTLIPNTSFIQDPKIHQMKIFHMTNSPYFNSRYYNTNADTKLYKPVRALGLLGCSRYRSWVHFLSLFVCAHIHKKQRNYNYTNLMYYVRACVSRNSFQRKFYCFVFSVFQIF